MKHGFLFSLIVVGAMVGIGVLAQGLDLPWILGVPVVVCILYGRTRLLLTAMEFPAVLISVLAVLTVVGTMLYGPAFFGQFWFVTLMGLLGVSSFLCLVKQIPKMRRVGYILIHSSIIVVLAGSATRSYLKEEGMVHLVVGDSTDLMIVMEEGRQIDREARLPFTVRLDDFQVEFYEMVYVFLPEESAPVIALNVERSRETDVAGAHIKVLGSRIHESPSSPGNPPVSRRFAIIEVDGEKGEIPANVSMGNDKLTLLYKPDSGDVKLYQSRVTILDNEGNELKTQDVVVNHPLIHDGWWLYQSNWNPRDLQYSGLQAVRDPGLPIALAGLLILVMGVLLKIRLPRRRKEGGAV